MGLNTNSINTIQNIIPEDSSEKYDYKHFLEKYGKTDLRTIIHMFMENKEIGDQESRTLDSIEIGLKNNSGSYHPYYVGACAPYEDIYDYSSAKDEPVFIHREFNITITDEIVKMVNENSEKLRTRLPTLVRLTKEIVAEEENLKHYAKALGYDQLPLKKVKELQHIRLDVNNEDYIESCKTWEKIFQVATGPIATALSKQLGKHRIELRDIDRLWPQNKRNIIAQRLPYTSQIILFANLSNLIYTSGIPEYVVNFKQYAGVSESHSKRVTGLLTEFPELIDSDLLSYVGQVAHEFDEKKVKDIRVNLLEGQHKSLYLKGSGEYPIYIIDNYAGYQSCVKTEPRLKAELEDGAALLLRLNFETETTSVLFAIKFEEVILMAVIESDDPRFIEGMTYRPVGDFVSDLKQIKDKEYALYENVKIPKRMHPIIFAKNRLLNYDHEIWKSIKDSALSKERNELAKS